MTVFSKDNFDPQAQQLYSLPALSMQLVDSFNDPNVEIETIEVQLKQDPALVAHVLRVANSPFFGLTREIASVREALVILGMATLKNMVTASVLMKQFPNGNIGRFEVQRFWTHSLAVASGASKLAKTVGANADEAFICGLLHDIGHLVLAGGFQESYDAIIDYREENDCNSITGERAVLDCDHTEIGQRLADSWNFPPSVQQSIRFHHAPAECPQEPTIAAVVCVADWIMKSVEAGVLFEGMEFDQIGPVLKLLRIKDDGLHDIATKFEELFSEVSAFAA